MTSTAEKEREYFNRFSEGIVGTGTLIAQDVLTKFIPCNNLSFEVQNHPVRYGLDKNQKSLVTNAAADGYGKFDITFIYRLLRNVCINFGDPSKPNLPSPTRGWGKDPRPNHTTPSDDIERIRILKNTYYSHFTKAALPEQEYRVKWQELTDICTRMGTYVGKDYLGELQKIDNIEGKIQKLRNTLLKYNHGATQRIQVFPLERFGKKLSIDQMYASVVIRQDLEQMEQEHMTGEGSESKPERKEVNTFDDMFYRDCEPCRFVFMQGEAGHGKTTFCLQLVRHWCNAKQTEASGENLSDWERGVGEFKFLFLVTLRHVEKSRSSLVDMICSDTNNYSSECREAIRHVLSSEKHRCLVILDGLDEWKPNAEARSDLNHQGIPNIGDMPNCTFFVSSRPWKLDVVADLIQYHDRVIEIEGLSEEGVKIIIKNVLVNYYKLNKNSSECIRYYEYLRGKMKSIMRIPLLLIVSIAIWYRKEKVGDSMTTFYMALVKMLIERTFEHKPLDISISKKFRNLNLADINIPPLLENEHTIIDFFVVLYTLGEITYQDLMSSETSLVFEKTVLERKIGEAELEFALKVGLLSQCEAPSCCYTKQVSINFLHKSMQEFQAAIYISSRNGVSDDFCKHLNNTKVIMELSNVIMFTLGLSPSLGSVLSQQIARVVNTDSDICKYRDTFDNAIKKARLLHSLQVRCYAELKQGLSVTQSTEPPTFHVSDVYLGMYITNKLKMSVDMMCNNPTNVVSLYLKQSDKKERGITDSELKQILDSTVSLKYLFINGGVIIPSRRCISTVSDRLISLKTLHLEYVKVTSDALRGLQRCIQDNVVLQSLTLKYITCMGDSLHDVLLCLPNSPCLSSLHIGGLYNAEDKQILVSVLPQLPCIHSAGFTGTYRYTDAAVIDTLSRLKQVQKLQLWNIIQGDRTLQLSSEMTQIEKVELCNLKCKQEAGTCLFNPLSTYNMNLMYHLRAQI